MVPARDQYENLSEKMAAVCKFLAFVGFDRPVVKVDDDISCTNSTRFADLIRCLTSTHDLVGRVLQPSKCGISRSWHIGKCHDDARNTRPYSLIANCAFAQGDYGYALSPRAIQILGKSAIYFKDHFSVESSYEDIAVSKVLRYYEIKPYHFDFIEEGVLRSTDPRMACTRFG
jgi:hypothetical protein